MNTHRLFSRCLLGWLLCFGVVAPAATPQPGEAAMRLILTEGAHPDIELRDTARWSDALLGVYRKRGFAPLWFSGRQLTRQGSALLREMQAADSRGLSSADYEANRLAYLAIDLSAKASAGPEDIALLDTAFSICAARFVTDLHSGRIDPRLAGHDLDVPHAQLDVGATLLTLARTEDTAAALRELEPPFRHYELLKTALSRYRMIALEPDLTTLPPLDAPRIRAGEPYAGAPALRRLLRALGDLKNPSDPEPALRGVLDAELVAALIRFQSRHGLQEDGTLGAATYRQLTVPISHRVRQIELSLERARWLPPKYGSPLVIVNIPQFKLFAFHTIEDAEDAMLQMNVIVGKAFPSMTTPVFAADMRYIVLNPYWDVPYSILARELLPEIRRNPSWVERNGYEIVRGGGDDATVMPVTPETVEALARGALRLRQKPGPRNALGAVKFMFPNRHNVYLHSTPATELFAQARRGFSHGCVRIADPMGMIRYVLRDDPSWTSERIEAALARPGPTRIPLRKPVRVFLLYATAIATERGDTLFFEDIYGHDARLDALLKARRSGAGDSSS